MGELRARRSKAGFRPLPDSLPTGGGIMMQFRTECASSKRTMEIRTRWTVIAGVIGMLAAPTASATNLLLEKALRASEAYTRARMDTRGFFVPMDWTSSPSSSSSYCVFKGIQPSYSLRFGRLNAVKCRHVKATRDAHDAFLDLADAPAMTRECRENANVAAKTFLSVSRTIVYADVAEAQSWRLQYWEPAVFRHFDQFDFNLDAIWSARAAASKAEFIASWKASDQKAEKFFSFWKSAYKQALKTAHRMYHSESPFDNDSEIDTLKNARRKASATARRALEYLQDEVDVAVSRVLACTKIRKDSS